MNKRSVIFVPRQGHGRVAGGEQHDAQPDKFPSIPAAMWWGVATLTTVGYGDVFPITPLGKVLGAVVAILGVGLFALPTGILASGFSEGLQRSRRRDSALCPHCGADTRAQQGN